MTKTTDRPVCTIAADVEGSGLCFIPDVFAPHLQHLCASLDWARVWNNSQDHLLTAGELDAAAESARAIADQCAKFAANARRMAEDV